MAYIRSFWIRATVSDYWLTESLYSRRELFSCVCTHLLESSHRIHGSCAVRHRSLGYFGQSTTRGLSTIKSAARHTLVASATCYMSGIWDRSYVIVSSVSGGIVLLQYASGLRVDLGVTFVLKINSPPIFSTDVFQLRKSEYINALAIYPTHFARPHNATWSDYFDGINSAWTGMRTISATVNMVRRTSPTADHFSDVNWWAITCLTTHVDASNR